MTTYVSDSFNRANSTTLGTADTGQAWNSTFFGSFGINNNQAYSTDTVSEEQAAVLDSAQSDIAIQVTLTTWNDKAGVAFRWASGSSYWVLRFSDGTSGTSSAGVYFLTNTGSGPTNVIAQNTATSAVPKSGDTIALVASGTTITAYLNGTQVLQATGQTYNQTATKIALWQDRHGNSGTLIPTAYWDNLTVTDPASYNPGGTGTAHNVTLSDSVTTSDTIALVRTLHVAISDSVVSSDAITRAVNRALAFSDSVTSSDALNTQSAHSYAISMTDAVTLSDSLTMAQAHAYSLSFSDSVTTSDADTKAASESLHDAITATDAMAQVRTYFRNYADSVTSSDSVTKQMARALAFSDGVTVTDAVTAQKVTVYSINLSDSVSVTDAITSLNRILSIALSDSIVTSDSVTMTGGKILNPIRGSIQLLASLDNKITLLASLDNKIELLAGVAPVAQTNQNFTLEQFSSDTLTFTYGGDLSGCTLEWIMQYNVNSTSPLIKKTTSDGISITSTSSSSSTFTVSITNTDMSNIGQGSYYHQASVVDALSESNPISKGTVTVSAASNN